MATLLKAISSSDTTLSITPDVSFPAVNGLVAIGSESLTYSVNYMGTLYGCVRGVNGTSAASHAIGASVTIKDFYSATPVVFTKAPVFPTASFLASAGTIIPDATAADTVLVTVDAAATIHGPTNGYDGQKIIFRLAQDGTGHTVTFSTGAGNFVFGSSITSFTASGANAIDYVGAIYDSAVGKWHLVSVVQGF